MQAFFNVSLTHSENFIFDFLAARLKATKSFGVMRIIGKTLDAGLAETLPWGLPTGRFFMALI